MDAVATAPSEAIDLASERSFRVGRASIDPVSREATFDGKTERLQPQNLKVLVALVRESGTVVTRDQLVDHCWNSRFVGDDVINRAIANLRQFAERAGGFSIETVPRAGYRLVETRPRLSRRWVIAAAASILLALGGIAVFEWAGRETTRPMPAIAILPFTTASADPAERELASNARDAVAHTLSQTQFRVSLSDASPRESAAPDFIVSAGVASSSEKMAVTVRVEDAVHQVIVYSSRFETDRANRDDLPDRIGAQIAGSLGWTASLLMLEKSHPSDPAITAELFGQTNDLQIARQIAAKAPNSAIAQMALAFAVVGAILDAPRDQRAEVLEIGRRAAERLSVLAPESGSPSILWCWLHSHARMIECEDRLRAGMRIEPASPWVDNILAGQLKDVGRHNEALAVARNSLVRDQYAPGKIGLVLRMLEGTGRKTEADQLYRQAKSWWPDDGIIFWDWVYGMLARGAFESLAAVEPPPVFISDFDAARPALGAVQAKDIAAVRKLCPITQEGSFKRDVCMVAFVRLGDNDDAFALASRIYPNRIGRSPAEEDKIWLDDEGNRYGDSDILTGLAAAPLRRDPRYLELARSLGLLAYWRSGRLPDFCQPPTPEPICSRLR